MAAPWTVRRTRKRGTRRIVKGSPLGAARISGASGWSPGKYSWSARFDPDAHSVASAATVTTTSEPADTAATTANGNGAAANGHGPDVLSFTSYLDAEPPSYIRSRRPAAGPETRSSVGGRRVALPLFALLVVVALVLTAAIVGLANRGISAARPLPAGTGALVVPAPAVAGGLPRHYRPVTNTVTQALISEFARLFTAVTARATGPSALYREPGTIDLATDQPAWVMYLGFNSAANLGAPSATAAHVMAHLVGSSAPSSSWVAKPGLRGGSARCGIAQFGTTAVSLCVWATERTVGALMSPTADTRGNELAALMPEMRLDLQN